MNTLSLPNGTSFEFTVTTHADGSESFEIGNIFDADGNHFEPADTLSFLDRAEAAICTERGMNAIIADFDAMSEDAEIPMGLLF